MAATYSTTSELALAWDLGLHRSFTCAGRIVWVSLASLRAEDGALRFDVRWAPAPPLRMLSSDIAAFDAGKREAQAAIGRHLASLAST